jgi:hypothetical protein
VSETGSACCFRGILHSATCCTWKTSDREKGMHAVVKTVPARESSHKASSTAWHWERCLSMIEWVRHHPCAHEKHPGASLHPALRPIEKAHTCSGIHSAALTPTQLAGMKSPSHQAQSPSSAPSRQSCFSLLSPQLTGALGLGLSSDCSAQQSSTYYVYRHSSKFVQSCAFLCCRHSSQGLWACHQTARLQQHTMVKTPTSGVNMCAERCTNCVHITAHLRV